MKLTVGEHGVIQLEEVFNPILLKTTDGSEITIAMRDGTLEVTYKGVTYAFGDSILPLWSTDQPINDGEVTGPSVQYINGCFYESDGTTSMNCKHCGQSKFTHNHGVGINQRT